MKKSVADMQNVDRLLMSGKEKNAESISAC